MPRARNIKHSFFSNDELGEIDPLGRLLFIGLWTLADYKGDLEWREKRVKAQILPYDNCDIKKLAINLDKSGFIRFYSNGNSIYLNIVNFAKHQNPHKNERNKGSDIPGYCEEYRQAIDLKGVTINLDKSGLKPECSHSNRADSCSLIPDSCSLIPEQVESEFDRFWKAGMVKHGKKSAFNAFKKIAKKQKDLIIFTDKLIFDIRWRLENQQIGFDNLYPATYLNGERWNDERRPRQHYQSGSNSLASESERQTRIIQAQLAAGEFDQCTVGQNGAALSTQVGESGRPKDGEQPIDAEFFDVVPKNGGFN